MSFTIKQFDGTSTNHTTSGKAFGKKTLGELFPNCTIYCSDGKHGFDSIEEQLAYAAARAERLYNEVYEFQRAH